MKRKKERDDREELGITTRAALELNAKLRAGVRLAGLETEDMEAGETALCNVARVRGWSSVWYRRSHGEGTVPEELAGPGELSRFLSMWYDTRSGGMAVIEDAGRDLRHPGVAAWLREIAKMKDAPAGAVVAMGRKVSFPRVLRGCAYVVSMRPDGQKKPGRQQE